MHKLFPFDLKMQMNAILLKFFLFQLIWKLVTKETKKIPQLKTQEKYTIKIPTMIFPKPQRYSKCKAKDIISLIFFKTKSLTQKIRENHSIKHFNKIN